MSMKIHFIGLSSFLIENAKGYRVLVDPFNDAPEWTLGPKFPKQFNGKPFGTNLMLISEPDSDHSYAPGGWLQNAPETKPNSDPFPSLQLTGTVIYEWNGDVNIAWNYTIDGIRIAHFADNAHELTPEQIKEIGHLDVIFISPPKPDSSDEAAMQMTRKNIASLNPKVIIWAHHIAPKDLPKTEDSKTLRNFFVQYFKKSASTNQFYKGEESFVNIGYILENAYILNKEYSGVVLDETSFEIKAEDIKKTKQFSVLFRAMLAE